LSFEPVKEAFAVLQQRAAADSNWEAFNLALGDYDGEGSINVASNLMSSSLLAMGERHRRAIETVEIVRTEGVKVRRLDDLDLGGAGPIYIKLDVQGAELSVLTGAELTLARAAAVEAEVSLVTLYDSQPLFPEVTAFLRQRGFVLVRLQPAFADVRTGELLQLDAVFARA
jgi:FkbM family methyltransferase